MFDVAVDLRAGSPTFLQWHAEELTPENARMLVIPEGCAHGFQVLEPDSGAAVSCTRLRTPRPPRAASASTIRVSASLGRCRSPIFATGSVSCRHRIGLRRIRSMNCRHCGTSLNHVFLDLGFAPPSNAYLSAVDLIAPERYFPLKLYVCEQLLAGADRGLRPGRANSSIGDYAYFSSVSQTWLDHAARYAEMIRRRLNLDGKSFVIEVASNDGYLLKNFVAAGIPCLGIEPTASTAAAAEAIGIPILREFFGKDLGGTPRREKAGRPTSSSATTSMRTCRTSTTSPPASPSR